MIALAISNKIAIVNDCENVFLKYKGNVNQYGFEYENDETFYQQVRIGAYLRSDVPEIKEKVYRKSNGEFRRGNTIVDKKVNLETDLIDEPTRDALAVALKHSDVIIDDVSYFCIGDVEITDNDINNLANAKATLYVQGYNQQNFGC